MRTIDRTDRTGVIFASTTSMSECQVQAHSRSASSSNVRVQPRGSAMSQLADDAMGNRRADTPMSHPIDILIP